MKMKILAECPLCGKRFDGTDNRCAGFIDGKQICSQRVLEAELQRRATLNQMNGKD